MGAAASLLFPGPASFYAVAFGLVSCLTELFLPYERYARFLKYLTLVLFAYVATALAVEVQWSAAVIATFVPRISLNRDALLALVAVLGTTLSPYLLVWQASQEAEEIRAKRGLRPLRRDHRKVKTAFARIRLDTYVGMAYSNLIAFFIILTCAAAFHAKGIHDLESAAQAAEALRPLAGPFAFALFSLGVIGTGLLAVPVLAGSAAYGVSGFFGWKASLDHPPGRAPAFYSIIVVATVVGAAMPFTGVDPMRALYGAAIINGVVAAPVMAGLMLVASDDEMMGRLKPGAVLTTMGWLATALMALAALAPLATSAA